MVVTSLRTTALMGLCLLSEVLGAKLVVSHFSNAVYTLDFDASKTGADALKIQQKYTNGGQMPAWIHVDKASNTIMSVDESWLGGATLTQYSIGQDGSLAVVGATSTPGGSVFGSFYGGANGKSFFATPEYTPSTVTLYKMPISSSSKPIQGLTFTMDKPGPRPDRQDKPHPHATFPDPTGNFLIVPDLGADLTRIFKIDRNSGKLTACPAIASRPGDGPRHGVFRKCASGAQKYYSLNEVSSSVGVYDVTYPSGGGCPSLTLTQSLSNYGPGKTGLETEKSAEIRIAGNHLYASNRNDQTFGKEQDSIAIYKIGSDGKLEFQELTNSFGYYPRSFDISKDGSFVAVGGQTTSNVVILKRDASTGKLGPVIANLNVGPRGTYGGEDGLSSVTWVE